MTPTPAQPRRDRRRARHEATKNEILDTAWSIVRSGGYAALSLRALAHAVDMEPQSVYTYFASKNAIYDAMFGRAAAQFADRMAEPYDSTDPRDVLAAYATRFAEFCTSDLARYQLLFQRALPRFEPSSQSYALVLLALDGLREVLARNEITEPRHLDLASALVTGLVDQQVANDAGGDRWIRLIDESIDMFLAHCQASPAPLRAARSCPED